MMLLVAIVGVLVAVYFVVSAVRPLVQSGVVTAEDWQRIEDEASALLERRDRLVEELRELEFEAALDKVNADDLAALRARYEAEAVDLVRRLDERVEDYEGRIEREVDERLRRPKGGGDAPAGGAVASAGAEAPASERAEVPPAGEGGASEPGPDGASADAPTCGACGIAAPPDAAFCDACGAALEAARCEDCGAVNRIGARFCKGCGAALAARETA